MSGREQLDGCMQSIELIVIGASAGAVAALTHLLPSLPGAYPLPILIAVHISPRDTGSLVALFRERCRMTVKEAEDKEPIAPSIVYFAAPDYHLLVERTRVLSLSNEEAVNFSRPSIDLLFTSAADAYGSNLLAIVLSGANHDGSKGIAAVSEAGGAMWVQAPDTADARSMPDAALAASARARALGLDSMTELLTQGVERR